MYKREKQQISWLVSSESKLFYLMRKCTLKRKKLLYIYVYMNL